MAAAAATLVAVPAWWLAVRWGLWAGITLVALVTGMSAWLIWRATIAPLEQLQHGLQLVAAGQINALAGDYGPGRVGEIAAKLQLILERDRVAEGERARLVSQMRSMLEHATVGLVITVDRKIEIVSRAFWVMFGYQEHEMLGQPGRLIYPSDQAYAEIGPRVGAAFAERGQFDAEIQMVRKDGSLFWCQMMGRPVDPSNMSAGTMWVLFDISDMRAQRERLEWASSHDSLTGLANRAAFERALDRVLEEGRLGLRHRGVAAVLLLDLDRFKQVNDSGGHAAGDQVLRDIAGLMTRRRRQDDVAARLGGDEFAILLDNCDTAHAVAVAESLCTLVRDYQLAFGGSLYSVGVSIGVVAINPRVGTRESLLAAVDAACYEAKKGGRGRVCVAGTPAAPLSSAGPRQASDST